MALYRYKAITADGEVVEGQYDVASNDEVIAKIQDAGNIPLEVLAADGAGGNGGLAGLFKREAMSQTQVLQFTQQLATLLSAGQPLDRALQILLELPESEKAKRVVERIRDHVRSGAPLSEALEAEPETRMRNGAVPPQIEIPFVIGWVHVVPSHILFQHFQSFFTLAAPNDLTNARD